jgi:hypothetical protein
MSFRPYRPEDKILILYINDNKLFYNLMRMKAFFAFSHRWRILSNLIYAEIGMETFLIWVGVNAM